MKKGHQKILSVLNIEIIQFKIQGKGFNINILVVKNILYALLSYVWNYLFNCFFMSNLTDILRRSIFMEFFCWLFTFVKAFGGHISLYKLNLNFWKSFWLLGGWAGISSPTWTCKESPWFYDITSSYFVVILINLVF